MLRIDDCQTKPRIHCSTVLIIDEASAAPQATEFQTSKRQTSSDSIGRLKIMPRVCYCELPRRSWCPNRRGKRGLEDLSTPLGNFGHLIDDFKVCGQQVTSVWFRCYV